MPDAKIIWTRTLLPPGHHVCLDNESAEIKSRKDYERFLHAHGFSRSQSKALAACGWSGIKSGEVELDPEEALVLLRQIAAALKPVV
jgi:hypothetical protein